MLRHYVRLSQENLGADLNIDVGQGTCTMKYSPKINDQLASSPKGGRPPPPAGRGDGAGHPGDHVPLRADPERDLGHGPLLTAAGAGSAAIYTNVSIIRAYHESRGEAEQRDEIITTIFSHPSNAACAQTAGFKVITLYPDEDGYPDLEALKAAVSERTAGSVDHQPRGHRHLQPPDRRVRATWSTRRAGCAAYDQANANGILGITRAREAGFDLCHFNLHKTFSTPHGCGGPGAGAVGVTEELARFLPVPVVEFDGERYYLDYDRPDSIGKIGPFYGNAP